MIIMMLVDKDATAVKFAILCNFLVFILVLIRGTKAIWPLPQSMSSGSPTSFLRLDPSFAISLSLDSASTIAPQDLLGAIERTTERLWSDKLGRLVVGRAMNDLPSIRLSPALKSLVLSIASNVTAVTDIAEEARKPIEERNEKYNLTIPSNGSAAILKAQTSLGLLRGLATFEQMWYSVADEDGEETYAFGVPIHIWDEPAFPYRGLMLDTARNFFTVSDIKRTLDTMSLVKLNVFYWHVSDSQSFPLRISGFEELALKGAYSNASIFTTDDVAVIVQYAGERGIDVVLELDSPGHSAAIGESHPEHIACFQSSEWVNFASGDYYSEPPAGQLRIASNDTINFTTSLFSAVAGILPSTLLSSGGDEVNLPCYEMDQETQNELRGRSIEQALDSFVVKTHGSLRSHGKTPLVKEDMLLKHNVTLGNDTIVVVWISSEDAAAVAQKGFRLVHQPSDYFYLDCGAGAWLGNDIGNSWCDPFKTWQKAYSFPPFVNLTHAQRTLVLGGQQPLWSEQSSPENLDSITWPRAAASAEVFWSFKPTNLSGNETMLMQSDENGGSLNATLTNALTRLHDVRYRMVQRGVKAIALQPEWCALRPGKCNA